MSRARGQNEMERFALLFSIEPLIQASELIERLESADEPQIAPNPVPNTKSAESEPERFEERASKLNIVQSTTNHRS